MALSGEDYIGADSKLYRDLAVDSDSQNVLLWVRKRIKDGQHLIVVATIHGHVLTKEITEEDAKRLYSALPAKAPRKRAFTQ